MKNRTETGQTGSGEAQQRLAKTHQDYWKAKLKLRSYVGRDGKRVVMPEWHVRMFHLSKEGWFNLGTPNRDGAAIMARDIFLSLKAVGWAATEAKYKPDPAARAGVCTVGEFLAEITERSGLRPVTVRRYAIKLRKIVADLARVEEGLKVKAKRRKFDYAGGGRAVWLEKVDGQRLDVLTPEAVNQWRSQYVAKAVSDPMQRRSAERSAASCIRCARALFNPDVLGGLRVRLPLNPFAGVKLRDPGPQRYHSDVDPEWLLASAAREYRADKPTLGAQEYLALNLCLWAGLRRKEADLLTWKQVNLEGGQVHIRRTPYFEPKTEESQRNIDLPAEAVEILRAFKQGGKSEFVLEGAEARPNATYDYYRADATWRNLNAWLKGKGVARRRPFTHYERKAAHWWPSTSGSKRHASISGTGTYAPPQLTTLTRNGG